VCNRGTAPVAMGVPVGFYVGANKVCSTTTMAPIAVGKCITVDCTWTTPPPAASGAVNVKVVVDDGGKTPECDTSNDQGLVADVFCIPPQ
jgi:hypothetical protein